MLACQASCLDKGARAHDSYGAVHTTVRRDEERAGHSCAVRDEDEVRRRGMESLLGEVRVETDAEVP